MVKNQSWQAVYKEPQLCTVGGRTTTITTRKSQYPNTTVTTTPHEQELKSEKEWEEQSNKTRKEKQRLGKSVIAGMH